MEQRNAVRLVGELLDVTVTDICGDYALCAYGGSVHHINIQLEKDCIGKIGYLRVYDSHDNSWFRFHPYYRQSLRRAREYDTKDTWCWRCQHTGKVVIMPAGAHPD